MNDFRPTLVLLVFANALCAVANIMCDKYWILPVNIVGMAYPIYAYIKLDK